MKDRGEGAEAREQFRQGVELFNAQKFFEAHESWEAIWLDAREPNKTFLQAITQVSAAFHHYAQGNRAGAKSLLQKGLKKLEQFPAGYRGLMLENFRAELREWVKALTKREDDPKAERPKIEWE
ncbi:MAG: DUF309 domain-containing protein [Acidobacteria bacterium]|nr:DUF309 domain-containing protein [Acidobacteriota bacterium]MBI3664510.1 DUF309 domain-containing protein [Acidobacteriota bacterium]